MWSKVGLVIRWCCGISATLFAILAAVLTFTYGYKYEQESGLVNESGAMWMILTTIFCGCVSVLCFSGGCSKKTNESAIGCGVYCSILTEIIMLICSILVSVSVSRNENLSSAGKGVGISAAVFTFCSMFLVPLASVIMLVCHCNDCGGGSGGGSSDGDGGGGGGGGVTSRSYQPRREETANSGHSLTEDQKRQLQAYLNSLAPEQRNAIIQYMLAKSQGENPTAPEGMTEEQVQIIIVMAIATN